MYSVHIVCVVIVCAVTEMLVNVLSLKDDDLVEEGDEKIKPGSGTYTVYCACTCVYVHACMYTCTDGACIINPRVRRRGLL